MVFSISALSIARLNSDYQLQKAVGQVLHNHLSTAPYFRYKNPSTLFIIRLSKLTFIK